MSWDRTRYLCVGVCLSRQTHCLHTTDITIALMVNVKGSWIVYVFILYNSEFQYNKVNMIDGVGHVSPPDSARGHVDTVPSALNTIMNCDLVLYYKITSPI